MLKYLRGMLDPVLNALDPLRRAEWIISQSFGATTRGEELLVSLVRLEGEFKVVFKLPRDLETGNPSPIALPSDRLDEMIAFLKECRRQASPT